MPTSPYSSVQVEKVRGRGPSIGQDIDDEGRDADVQNVLSEVTKYCLVQAGGGVGAKICGSEKIELGRLPIVGVFHKMANERGVPHSFISEFTDAHWTYMR